MVRIPLTTVLLALLLAGAAPPCGAATLTDLYCDNGPWVTVPGVLGGTVLSIPGQAVGLVVAPFVAMAYPKDRWACIYVTGIISSGFWRVGYWATATPFVVTKLILYDGPKRLLAREDAAEGTQPDAPPAQGSCRPPAPPGVLDPEGGTR